MEQTRDVFCSTVILAFVAGFCDAATYIGANQLFSAHVTGNFVVLAYDLFKGADRHTWIKLICFPVFIASVITAGWVAPKLRNGYFLLIIEGITLVISGALAILLSSFHFNSTLWNTSMAFLIVWAMGFQNAYGRLYMKSVYAPTTIMTGNVTQLSLDFAKILIAKNHDAVSFQNINKQFSIVAGFLGGCLVGGLAASNLGLWTVLFPGLLVIILFYQPNTSLIGRSAQII